MTPMQVKQLFTIGTGQSTRGTNNEVGTGLGIILCKEFVEKNHGKLVVSSQTGSGTTVSLLLATSKASPNQHQ